MYVLCATEWSFRAISYCFVHRRTSRFGSRFGSKRIFKNMVELFGCKMQEKAPKSADFGAFCTSLSAICTLTAFLFCAVPVINPLALHNEGDWGNAIPRTALRCIKISLIFLALFFQRCHFHPENPSLRIYLDTSTALPSLRTLKISGIGLASSSSVRVRGV